MRVAAAQCRHLGGPADADVRMGGVKRTVFALVTDAQLRTGTNRCALIKAGQCELARTP